MTKSEAFYSFHFFAELFHMKNKNLIDISNATDQELIDTYTLVVNRMFDLDEYGLMDNVIPSDAVAHVTRKTLLALFPKSDDNFMKDFKSEDRNNGI